MRRNTVAKSLLVRCKGRRTKGSISNTAEMAEARRPILLPPPALLKSEILSSWLGAQAAGGDGWRSEIAPVLCHFASIEDLEDAQI